MQIRRRRRRWPWVLGSVAMVLVAALAYGLLAWPRGTLRVDAAGLPQVQLPRLAGRLLRVSMRNADGTPIPVAVRATSPAEQTALTSADGPGVDGRNGGVTTAHVGRSPPASGGAGRGVPTGRENA